LLRAEDVAVAGEPLKGARADGELDRHRRIELDEVGDPRRIDAIERRHASRASARRRP
jgi:hypothetical protein